MLIQQSIGSGAAQGPQSAADEPPSDGLKKLVQFVHPEKIYGFLPGFDEERLAGLYGLDVTTYRKLRGQFAATQSDARWVWITPPTVNERLASTFPAFQQIQLTLRNEDLLAVGDVLRGQSVPGIDVNPVHKADHVVDIQAVFGQPAPPTFVLSDGTHLSLVGHRAIVTALIERLTARPGEDKHVRTNPEEVLTPPFV